MTVNEEADSVPYGETQDAAEITETVEESSETVTQVTVTESTETEKAETAAALSEAVTEDTTAELSQTGIEVAAAEAAKATTEDAAETDLQNEPSEGELIERDTGTGIE